MATITIFSGSTRTARKADTVVPWIADGFRSNGHTVHIIDPNEHSELQVLHVPNHYNPNPSADMKKISEWINSADAIVLITPEYNHSFSGALKNAIDAFMPEYEGKPFGIVSYSTSPFGGIRAAIALRAVIAELKAVSTPHNLMIPLVQKAFDEQGKLQDQAYVERRAKFVSEVERYAAALKTLRAQKSL